MGTAAVNADADMTAVRRDGEGRRTTGLEERWTDRWAEVAFEDRMATVEFRVGERAHITVDSQVCRSCTTRACVTACPANLFAPTSDGGILFNYEQCFECGTCYQVCDGDGAITWTYPDGGHGVVFRHG
jgi:ferredoxin like protein